MVVPKGVDAVRSSGSSHATTKEQKEVSTRYVPTSPHESAGITCPQSHTYVRGTHSHVTGYPPSYVA